MTLGRHSLADVAQAARRELKLRAGLSIRQTIELAKEELASPPPKACGRGRGGGGGELTIAAQHTRWTSCSHRTTTAWLLLSRHHFSLCCCA
eukprot:scaffold41320_cov208-Isochrysis_galbana.AAC.1